MTDIGKSIFFWLAIILAISIGTFLWVQNSLLFYPNTSIYNWSPGTKTLDRSVTTRSDTVEEEILIPDGKEGLSAYYIKNFPEADFILYCHGTSGNIADRKYVYDISLLHGFNLLLFDYRGYGKSKGYPTVDGILKDGLEAFDYLRKTKMIPNHKIIVWGESLGGAVCAYIARNRQIKGAVLMATFSSMDKLILNHKTLGWIKYPVSLISKVTLHPLNTAKWISQANCPVVVMHSRSDDLIAFECGYENFTRAKEPKKFIEIGGTHITPDITYDNVQETFAFINKNRQF